jgi:hypothetical protein
VGLAGEVLTFTGEGKAEKILETPGVTAVHVLERDRSLERPRTSEEGLRRGADESVERIVVVEGHDLRALTLPGGRYRLSHALTA